MTNSSPDYSAFDSKRLKLLNWLGRRYYVVVAPCLVLLASMLAARIPGASLMLLIAVGLPGYMWLKADSWLPGNAFAFGNQLDKFFMKHDTDYLFMRDEYQSLTRSAFMKHEQFVWSITVNDVEIPIMFTDDGGCIAWVQLERKFPHIVVDSLADNHWFHKQMVASSLPTQKIQLEGDFPDYFHVFMDPGQQLITLQILSPDRMQYLVDDLRDINLEIQDDYLRLYAAHAQRSSQSFQAFLKTLGAFQGGLKVANLNSIQ